MTKITVEQAVRAVQSSTTAEEVQAVLEQCKKDQPHEVFLAVTGSKSELCPKSWKKADLVSQYTAKIVAFKAREAFKAMSAEARAEYLTSQKYKQDNNCVDSLTRLLSLRDLIMLNAALGVSFEEYQADRNSMRGSLNFILGSFVRHEAQRAKFVSRNQVNAVEETSKLDAITEAKPDYEAAFDEDAHTPDVQEVSVIVDDIPADHEPDAQPKAELPEAEFAVSVDYAAIVSADISIGKPENMGISDQIYNALNELSEEDLILLAKSERMHSVIACYTELGLSKRGLVLSIGGVITNRLKKLIAGEEIPSGCQEVIHDKYGACVVDVPLDTPMVRAFHEHRKPENEAFISATVGVKADVQEVSTPSKETVSRSKKKTRKSSRKSHTQYWEQFSQSKSKTSRHNPNSKPLIKATRAALSVRIKKF